MNILCRIFGHKWGKKYASYGFHPGFASPGHEVLGLRYCFRTYLCNRGYGICKWRKRIYEHVESVNSSVVVRQDEYSPIEGVEELYYEV